MNIFDAPTMKETYFGDTMPRTNLGNIDWYGAGMLKAFKGIGPGSLNFFADAAVSVTHPNQNVSSQFGFQGLLTGAFFQPEAPSSKTGTAFAIGLRYDLPSRTKFGFEYNHGSENWITFAPAADDMWTSKAGVRGNVYEAYLIQELEQGSDLLADQQVVLPVRRAHVRLPLQRQQQLGRRPGEPLQRQRPDDDAHTAVQGLRPLRHFRSEVLKSLY